jgi:hypothetical protein
VRVPACTAPAHGKADLWALLGLAGNGRIFRILRDGTN